MTHPRLEHYPHHQEYVELANAFRPFAMFTHEPNFRSQAVNTDYLGLRETYDAQCRYIDLARCTNHYERCNLLVGGSTAFGVDASDDLHAVTAALQQPDTPCLNLGVRGAVSHQELQMVLLLRRMLPPIRNVVLLSGLNLASMASLDDTIFYPEFGGIFSEPWHYDAMCDQYTRLTANAHYRARRRALTRLDQWFRTSRLGAFVANCLAYGKRIDVPDQRPARISFADKLQLLEQQWESDLATWSATQRVWGYKAHFVLQPAVGWTRKPLAPIEARCIQADMAQIPSLRLYANREFYESYRARVAQACERHAIAFHDANLWFDDATANQELFTDICHLTDQGYALLGRMLREKLDWNEEHDAAKLHQAA